jgi:hypothetical protein
MTIGTERHPRNTIDLSGVQFHDKHMQAVPPLQPQTQLTLAGTYLIVFLTKSHSATPSSVPTQNVANTSASDPRTLPASDPPTLPAWSSDTGTPPPPQRVSLPHVVVFACVTST